MIFRISTFNNWMCIVHGQMLHKHLTKILLCNSFVKVYFFSNFVTPHIIHSFMYFTSQFQNDIFGSLNDSSLLSRASEALVAVDIKHPVSVTSASQLANAAGAIAAGHISSAASQAAFSQIKVIQHFFQFS